MVNCEHTRYKATFKILMMVLVCAAHLNGAPMKAGVATTEITPAGPIWMGGYAARTHPSEGVLTPLWVKALALETSSGGRIVIVTADVIGIPRTMGDEVAAAVERQYGLKRSQLLLNASHTHTGPVVWSEISRLFGVPPEEEKNLIEYRRKLTAALVAVTGAALRDLAPASVAYGEGSADFAVNRRQPTAEGVKIGVNPSGPVDHTVPVLKVADEAGNIKAILFAYACHNTTLTTEIYQLSGDYAGLAAATLERRHPGAAALFLILCGGDQNPNPRGTIEIAHMHADALAAEVERTISGKMTPLQGPIRTDFRLTQLRLAPRSRQDLEAELKSPVALYAKRAGMLLKAIDAGKRIDRIDYPVQAVRFGRGLTLLALGGEVTVDYGLRVKREFPGEPVVTAAYSNDVMCYIPTARILHEGGYEAVSNMAYYGQAGPFADDVEDRVFAAIRQTMKAVGKPAQGRK